MGIEKFIPQDQFRYYYTLLSSTERIVYDNLVCGLIDFKKEIPCAGCHANRIQDILQYAKLDIPELFYIKSISLRYSPLLINRCTVLIEYRFKEDTVATILARMEVIAQQLHKVISHKAEADREIAIHDFLADRVQYRDLSAPYSHEAPGALLYNIGVCEGISKAFKYLADRNGLQSIVATGLGNDHGNEGGHAWNLCSLNGEFFHVDVTFDSTIADGCARYDYLNLSDKEIGTNHSWTDSLPICHKSLSHYKRLGLFFDSQQKLARFLRSQARNNRTIVFQLPRFTGNQQRLVDVVCKTVQDNLRCGLFETKRFSLSYNLNRMVFQINIL